MQRLFPFLKVAVLVAALAGCYRDHFIGERWTDKADRARVTWAILHPAREHPNLSESVAATYALSGVDRVSVDDEGSLDGGLKTDPSLSHLVKVEHRRGGDGTCDVLCSLQRGGFWAEELKTGSPRPPFAGIVRPPLRAMDGPHKLPGPQPPARLP